MGVPMKKKNTGKTQPRQKENENESFDSFRGLVRSDRTDPLLCKHAPFTSLKVSPNGTS